MSGGNGQNHWPSRFSMANVLYSRKRNKVFYSVIIRVVEGMGHEREN